MGLTGQQFVTSFSDLKVITLCPLSSACRILFEKYSLPFIATHSATPAFHGYACLHLDFPHCMFIFLFFFTVSLIQETNLIEE